ncbi:MAG: LamG-like jellyroll fold domain-containing protein [Pseudomonadota bacterium]
MLKLIKRWQIDSKERTNERGNIFAALFGAVVIVGAIGAGSVSLLQGPVSGMVALNKQNITEMRMEIASKLIMADALDRFTAIKAADGDTDSTEYIELVEYAAGAITGGGTIPTSLNINDIDPWGSQFGYCTWDNGDDTNDAKDDGGTGADNRLDGQNVATSEFIVLVSPGPNRTFEAGCYAYGDGGNDGIIKPSGSDDIVITYTYQNAIDTMGDLWEFGSDTGGTSSVLEIDENLDFRSDVAVTGLLTFNATAAGLVLSDSPGTTCSVAQEAQIFLDTSTTPDSLVICNAGTIEPVVEGASGSGAGSSGSVDSPLAHWTFDETSGTVASDISGNGYDGTMQNGMDASTASEIGINEGALRFTSASNHYIDTGLDLSGYESFTISMWVRIEGTGEQVFVSQGDSSGNGGGAQYEFTLAYGNLVGSGDERIQFHMEQNGGGGNNTQDLVPQQNFADLNNWRHFTITVSDLDGATPIGSLYFDGELINTDTAAAAVPRGAWNSNLYIGTAPNGTSGSFEGLIDDVRVYGYALNDEEVAAVYNISSGDIATNVNTRGLSLVNYYWGQDSGTTSPTLPPSPATDFIQVVGTGTGDGNSLGLKTDGTIWRWDYLSTPDTATIEIAGFSEGRAVQISRDRGEHCFLEESGTVYCWNQSDESDFRALAVANDFVKITGGGESTSCFLTAGGLTYCLGDDDNGALGNDEVFVDSFDTPVLVANITDFVDIDAGGEGACGIRKNGEAWCWGKNDFGQLGNGNTGTDSGIPVKVDTDVRFKKIASGKVNSCGISTDNEIWCWGSSFDELGDGNVYTSNQPHPILIADSEQDYIDLEMSDANTDGGVCGIKSNGKLFCWGSGNRNGLGFNTATPTEVPGLSNVIGIDFSYRDGFAYTLNYSDGDETAPTDNYVIKQQQDSGETLGSYGLSLTYNSTSDTDEVGIGFAIDDTSTTATDILSASIKAERALGGGNNLIVGTQSNAGTQTIGRLQIDREGGFGLHGNASHESDSILTIGRSDTRNWNSDYYYGFLVANDAASTDQGAFFGMDELTGAATILFTKDFTIAASNDDATSLTNILQLDVSSSQATLISEVTQSSTASPVFTSSLRSNTAAEPAVISFGRFGNTFTTAIPSNSRLGEVKFEAHDGTSVDTDGYAVIRADSVGAVGAGTVPTKLTISTDPAGNPTDDDLIIEPDGDVGIGVSTADSPLHVGGRGAANEGVRIGNDTNCTGTDEGTLRYTIANDIEYCNGSSWVAFSSNGSSGSGLGSCEHGQYFASVSLGSGNICGVYHNGRVACWGNGVGSGEMMTGEQLTATLDIPTVTRENVLSNIKKFTFGEEHSCALNYDGDVVCAGYNTEGELGAGYDDASDTERFTPSKVLLPGKAKDLFSGANHNCAIMEDSRVTCWGEGGNGQNGDGQNVDNLTPNYVENLAGVVDMYLGIQQSCAILKDRTLKCWGRNTTAGLLGIGSSVSSNNNTPQDIAITDVVKGTFAHSGDINGAFGCLLRADGTVWCVGDNAHQQLGNGAGSDQNTYTQVTGVSNIVDIAATSRGVLALRNDGVIFSWGTDRDGELGQNDTGSAVSSPTQIPNVTAVALPNHIFSNRAMCFISTDSEVYCMGDNTDGELGNDLATGNTSTPQRALNPLACDADKIAFVTSTNHTGDFGGIEGGDAICQRLADSENLPGTYYAWLGTDETDPATRFNQNHGIYSTPFGNKVVDDWADLIDNGIDASINYDETATNSGTTDVWTNVSSVGGTTAVTNPLSTCANWTSTSNNGQRGSRNSSSASWTTSGNEACTNANRLYCFQQ